MGHKASGTTRRHGETGIRGQKSDDKGNNFEIRISKLKICRACTVPAKKSPLNPPLKKGDFFVESGDFPPFVKGGVRGDFFLLDGTVSGPTNLEFRNFEFCLLSSTIWPYAFSNPQCFSPCSILYASANPPFWPSSCS